MTRPRVPLFAVALAGGAVVLAARSADAQRASHREYASVEPDAGELEPDATLAAPRAVEVEAEAVEAEPLSAEDAAPVVEPSWDDAPRPDEASGIATPERQPLHERLKWIPRAFFFIPRWTVWTVAQPVRYGAYASERYNIPNRVRRWLFTEDETFGIYPVSTYESGFGIDAGVRVVHENLFGARERMKLRANWGGRFRQAYGINLRSGERFGRRVALELDVGYARRPVERFYGIGNADLGDASMALLDPAGDVAVSTRFRESLVRAKATVDTHLVGSLALRASGALMMRELSGTEKDDSLDRVFDTTQLPGWREGVDNVYVEAELVYDSGRPASPFQTRAIDGTGWLASAYVGRTFGVGGDPSAFTRYGGELQRFIDLYDGSRILALRGLVEAVAGNVTFIDLPRLGGTDYLRGYPSARFRDRAVTLATVEYTWDLGNFMAAYMFVDAGRAWPSLADVRIDDSLRVGFGGGIQLHSFESFLMRLQIAASKDGDMQLELALSPAFGRRERAGRY